MSKININDEQTQTIINEAKIARQLARCDFSNFYVGAALLDENNNIYSGANIEFPIFSQTICAERNAIFQAVAKGMKKIKIIAVNAGHDQVISPCGACRQVIMEFSTKDTIIISHNQQENYFVWKMLELLPGAFDKESLFAQTHKSHQSKSLQQNKKKNNNGDIDKEQKTQKIQKKTQYDRQQGRHDQELKETQKKILNKKIKKNQQKK